MFVQQQACYTWVVSDTCNLLQALVPFTNANPHVDTFRMKFRPLVIGLDRERDGGTRWEGTGGLPYRNENAL